MRYINKLQILVLVITMNSGLAFGFNCKQAQELSQAVVNGGLTSLINNKIEKIKDKEHEPHLWINQEHFIYSKFLFQSFNYQILAELDPLNLILKSGGVKAISYMPTKAEAVMMRNHLLFDDGCVEVSPFVRVFKRHQNSALKLFARIESELLKESQSEPFNSSQPMKNEKEQVIKWRSYVSTFKTMEKGTAELKAYLLKRKELGLSEFSAQVQFSAFLKSLDPHSRAFIEFDPFSINTDTPKPKSTLMTIESNTDSLRVYKFKDIEEDLRFLKENKSILERAEKLIFDLREVVGGNPQTAIDIAGLLSGTRQCYKLSKRGGFDLWCSKKNKVKFKFNTTPLVLINEGTMSAGEVIAMGLKESGLFTLLGMSTFGKATGQYIVPLPDHYQPVHAFSYTWGILSHVNGGSWQLVGVTPDVTSVALERTRHESKYYNSLGINIAIDKGILDSEPRQGDVTGSRNTCFDSILSRRDDPDFSSDDNKFLAEISACKY